MLLGMLGWDKYDGKVEFITDLFSSLRAPAGWELFSAACVGGVYAALYCALNVLKIFASRLIYPACSAKGKTEALAASGIFPIGGIRSRAHWLDTRQMADGKHDYAFVHMTLKNRRRAQRR